MLSRRVALTGLALVGQSRIAGAQHTREEAETELILLAADGQADSVQTVNDIAARLGGPGGHLHAEAGRGALESAARLTDRPSAVAAILPSATLAYMERSGLHGGVVHSNCFIGRMGVSELHVLTSQRIRGLRELAGQKVNLGPRGGSTRVTASVWLDRMNLRVDPLYLDHDKARAAVLRGQIPAMILLAPKPARLFLDVKRSDGVHLLPVDRPGGAPMGLQPAQILPGDYPMLGGGETGLRRPVDTVGVPLVLACFSWSDKTPMFMALARLSDLLIQRGSGVRGFSMVAAVQGWERFPPVSDWLARGRIGTVLDIASGARRAPPAQPPDQSRAAVDAELTTEQKERLFQEFLNWPGNK